MKSCLILLSLFVVYGCSEEVLIGECVSNSDCAPSNCCHSDACGPIGDSPSCEDVFCSQECKPGTLDCGQGSCQCLNSKCEVVLNLES